MNSNQAVAEIDDMREEYDFANMPGGVQGKYTKELTGNATPILLDADIATIFPDSKSVNEALRTLARVLGHADHFSQLNQNLPEIG